MNTILILIIWYIFGLIGSGMGTAMINNAYNLSNQNREKDWAWWVVSMGGILMIITVIVFYYVEMKKQYTLHTVWNWNKWW